MTPDKTPTPKDAPLPCPFCGSSTIGHHEVEGRANHSFECCECLASSMCKPTYQEALEAWNRRKLGSPVVAVEPKPSAEGPPELWLQLHGDCADPELSEPVDYTAGDVTWCWHSIHDNDVRYVRADIAPQPTQAQAGAVPPIEWPKARDVGRIGDMSPSAHIRVGLDSDNDVFVSVWDEQGGGSIEFCNPGGGGGGQSSRTRMALIALMVAMEADNTEKPSRDWWALRMGGIKEGGQHAAD